MNIFFQKHFMFSLKKTLFNFSFSIKKQTKIKRKKKITKLSKHKTIFCFK